MSNSFPQGQIPLAQNSNSMNHGRVVHRPAGNIRIYHINGAQVQMVDYGQGLVQNSHPRMPAQPIAAYPPHYFPAHPTPYRPTPQQVRQPSSAPGSFMQNNAMGGVYAWSPYHCPGSFPHPAAMSHNIDVNISNHPGEGISQLSSVSAMSANTGVNQPHIGYTFPNNRMNMPNDMTNWGSTQPMRMPTSQATSTAGAPAFNFQLAANQHGTFQRNTFQHGTAQQGHIQQGSIQQGPFQQRTVQQAPLQQGAIPHGTVRHGQSQYGHDQHGRIQQGPAKRIKVENGTEQHMSNSYGLKQPAPGASRASVNPESSSPLQNPGNRDIEAITGSDDFLETVDPRDVQLIPEDNIGLDLDDQWLLLPPQHSQAVAQQYPDPAAQHGAGSPAGTPSGHVPPPLVHTTAPMTEEQVRQYSDLYQENYVGAWPDPTTASQAFAFMRQNAHQVSTNK